MNRVALAGIGLVLALVACGASPKMSSAPTLDDYAMTQEGATYRVVVHYDTSTKEWTPVTLPRMPYHHASRLTFVNLGDHPELDGLRAGRVELTIVLGAKDIRRV